MQHASFERRQGARQAACATFSSAVEKQGSQEEGSDLYPFLVLQYAAFLLHAFQDAAAGRAIYASALSSHPRIQRLWEVKPAPALTNLGLAPVSCLLKTIKLRCARAVIVC